MKPAVSEPSGSSREPLRAPRAPPLPPVRKPPVRLPEPPAYRVRAPGAPAACANCSHPIGPTTSPPLCWGCGRPLCADCYWRHGLTPAAHRCTSCLTRSPSPAVAISGGRRA